MQEVRIELLQRMAIFGGIRADTLQFLLAFCPIVSVSTNEFFFREHEQGDSMFVLEIGKAAVLKSWYEQDYLLPTLKGGDCFGEMAVMDDCPHSASVRAAEDCTSIRISSANLYQVYTQDIKQFALIQMNMGREVCRRLREADSRLFSASGYARDGQRTCLPCRLRTTRERLFVALPGRNRRSTACLLLGFWLTHMVRSSRYP